MKYKNISLTLVLAVLLSGLVTPCIARTDGGGKKNPQKYSNPNNRENCYYCWKDLSIDYTPSRHKYAKKS